MLTYFSMMQKRPTAYNVVIREESSDNNMLIVATAAHSSGMNATFEGKFFFYNATVCIIGFILYHFMHSYMTINQPII